jgi:ribonuclease D
MAHFLHKNDLPEGLKLGPVVAIDTETLGLNPHRDRLCLVQLSSGDGDAHLVQIFPGQEAPRNLLALLADATILKLFHFARFDLAILFHTFGVMPYPVYCTKIASKLVRTYTDRHGLRDLVRELVGFEISKQQQSSDWGAAQLSDAQLAYAASDVLHLHALRDKLSSLLEREGRTEVAQATFDYIPTRAKLDLMGWDQCDIFAHS